MAKASRFRSSRWLLLVLPAGIALVAVLLRSRSPLPSTRDTGAPPVIVQARAQLALGPVLAAEAAVARDPDDPLARRRLAEACAASGDPVGAALALVPLLDGVNGLDAMERGGRSDTAEHLHTPPGARASVPGPSDLELLSRYAGYCREIGWLDEAEAALRRLPTVPPRSWLDLAAAYAGHGQADRGIALMKGLRTEALQPEEWLEGAITWYHCRRLDEAVEWAERAAGGGGAPEAAAHARMVLARCLLAAGRPEAALAALLTDDGATGGGMEGAPSGTDPRVEFWRGRAEVRCSDPSLRASGRERLARLATADPANGSAAYEAGRAFLLAGAADRAVPLLSQAAVRGYQEVLAYALLTRAYSALGQRAEALWAQGRSQVSWGQYRVAAAAIRRSLELEPHKPLAYVDLARALHADGRLHEAVAVLERAQEAVPGDLDVSLLKAKLLLHLERVPEVVRELETAAKLDPKRANEPLGNLGTVYFDSQQFDRAIPPLERAVQLEDADAHAHFYLGRTYARQLEAPGRVEKAVAHLLRAARLTPDYSLPWMAAASALERMGYRSEAAACLRRAIAGEPQSDGPYVPLGQLLQRQERHSERRLILRRYAKNRNHDLTRTGLEKETRSNPRDAERRYALGNLLLREGQPDKALPELLAAVGIRPGWRQARSRLADACALLGYDDLREEAEP